MKHVVSLNCRWQLLLVMLLLWGPATLAQVPAWQSAIAMGQSGNESSEINSTTTDASGNVYMAGTYYGALHLGSITLPNNGGNIFVAKWNPATGFVWAQTSSTGNYTSVGVRGIAVAGSSVYVAAFFSGGQSIAFGGITATGPGLSTGLLVKLTDAGSTASFTWVQAVNSSDALATGVAVSGANVYLVGNFWGTATIGNTTLVNQRAQGAEMFVAKLVDSGATSRFAWAQRGGGNAWAVAANGANVYVTGIFSNAPTDFGASTLTNSSATYTPEVFVTKLTDAGSTAAFTWAKQINGTGYEYVRAMAVRGTDVFVAGEFGSSSLQLDALTLTNPQATASAWNPDMYVAKLTDAGSSAAFVWAQRAGGDAGDGIYSLAVRGAQVYVGGYSWSPSTAFGPITLTSGASGSLFVAKLLDAGASAGFGWVQPAALTSRGLASALTISGSGVYLGGAFSGNATFGSQTLTTTVNYQTAFWVSLTDASLLATAAGATPLAVALAPNPARTTATVRLPAVPGAAQATLTLLDALGRVMRTQRVALAAAGATAEVPLAGLAPGLYHLRVQAGGQQAGQPLVVE